MTFQFSVAVRNARLDVIETTIGTAPLLRMLSGSPPANCAAAQTGTLLVEQTLPSDWLGAAASGVKSKAGTWSGTGITNGTVGYYRVTDAAGTTCHEQGTITVTGGGGDMTIDNVVVATSQVVTVTAYSLTDGNA